MSNCIQIGQISRPTRARTDCDETNAGCMRLSTQRLLFPATMFSRSSSQSQAASRMYRTVNLRRSHIYIDHLPKEQWPPWIIAFAEKLTQDGPGSDPCSASGEFVVQSIATRTHSVSKAIAEQSECLLPTVRRLVASVEPYWQTFSRTVIFRALIEA